MSDYHTWVTWGLQGLLGFMLVKIWARLDENTKSINEMKIDMAKNYVAKEDWVIIRQRVHDLANWIVGEKAVREAAVAHIAQKQDRIAHDDQA